MAFVITHRDGAMESDGPIELLSALISELEWDNAEHPDIAISHESGWSLSAYPSGLVLWGNVDSDDPELRMQVPRHRQLELMRAVATGDLTTVDGQAWDSDVAGSMEP